MALTLVASTRVTSRRLMLSVLSLVGAACLFASFPAVALGQQFNDNFAGAEPLAFGGSFGFATNNSIGATKEPGEPDHAGNPGGHSLWYFWTSPASGSATIDTCDSEFDTLLAVYTGSSVSALNPVAGSDDSCGPFGQQSRVEFNLGGGTTIRIAVDGFDGDAGPVVVALEFLEEPPPCPPPGVPPGPTYRGTHSQGGTVCFTVTADWSTVTSFLIARLRDSDGSFCPDHWFQPVTPGTPLAISNRTFSRRQLSGSFNAGQGAAGTFGRAAPPPSCNPGLVSWSASTTGTPPWTVPLPVAAADKTAPVVRLSARSSQRAIKQKGIVIEVRCPTEACTATARAVVSVPGAAKTYRLKPATKQIPRGGKAKLKLKFSKKTLKAVRRALSKRKKIKARVTVTVKDAAGNGATKKRTIRLKR